jgi:hypothetical protein
MYRVQFPDGSAVYLAAESEFEARLRAKLMAWACTGKWWQVEVTKEDGR